MADASDNGAFASDDTALLVHRRSNPRANHPLLVWHLGIWNPIAPARVGPDQAGGQVDEATQARQDAATRYANGLMQRIKTGLSLVPDRDTGPDSFECSQGENGPWILSAATPLSCRFSLGALQAQILLDLQPEYLTITTLFDFAPETGERHWDQCPQPIRDLVAELGGFHRKIEEGLKQGVGRLSRAELTALADACFEDVWDHFGVEILKEQSTEFQGLGRRFADFRGLYLGDEALAPPVPMNAEPRPARFQLPFWRGKKPKPRDHRDKPLTQPEWRDRFHVLWPLMTAPVKKQDIANHEFTATIFEGSALHLTGMGARPRASSQRPGTPLYYGVFTSGMGGWAIGRLVSQLSTLGTLRLSATQEFPRLEAASIPLREAEIAVQEAFDRDLSKEGNADTRRKATEQLKYALEWIHGRKNMADKLVPGGIAYRAEQSANYISRFKDVLDGLRVEAYDDFQAYDKYVQAHHGADFNYIESLGARHVRLMHDMRSLYQRMVAEEGRNRYLEIVSIQRFAEFLSIAMLAPYYFGIVIAHTIWRPSDAMPRRIWAVFFIGGVALASTLSWIKSRKTRKKRDRSATWLIATALTAISILVFCYAAYNVAIAPTPWVEPSASEPQSNAG